MTRRLKWAGLFLVIPLVCLIGPGSAFGALVQLSMTDDFPCGTIPPKCPASVGILTQILNLFPDDRIELGFDERLDLDSGGACSELYIQAGGSLVLEYGLSGVNAEFFAVRDPTWPDYNTVKTKVQIDGVSASGNAAIHGENCIGFIDFTIPLSVGMSVPYLVMDMNNEAFLDTATDKVELNDWYSHVTLGGFDYDSGLGELIDILLYPLVYSAVSETMDELLLEENGLIFNLVEDIMDGLYHIQPCGCLMVPSAYQGNRSLVGHILANMMCYLLPVGLVVVLKRRKR